MPSRRDVLATNLEDLQQDLLDLWQSLTRDPVKEARKERAWTVLSTIFVAAGTIAARRVAVKVWGVLTGETAPVTRPPQPTRGRPSARPPSPGAEPVPEPEPERGPTTTTTAGA